MSTTCREEVLDAFHRLEVRTGRRDFTPAEVVDEVFRVTRRYQSSTIRTHVTSRMCAQAPEHHGTVYADLERVRPGQYRRRDTPRSV